MPLPSLRNQTSLSLWSSEDVGLPADWKGAACLGRILNTNFVRMNATSTLVRSLAWAVHPSLPGIRDGLIEAVEPWSGRRHSERRVSRVFPRQPGGVGRGGGGSRA
ncbi:GALC [Symbiodinium natans]|uniref:GALC protein n=1 Tax=Symbiodinium natans TaxID=878477 RepID=A0A812S465_9DINO|nr:GALC [Symbiodinium natans]